MSKPESHTLYVQQKNIDKAKWDSCVANADNGLVYAYSWYLDALAGNWDAIIIGNYEYVMPLPYRTKFTINYLFQPDLTPVLGLFGNGITQELVMEVLSAIPSKFKLWDISLNHFNPLHNAGYPDYRRSNYTLFLDRSYSDIQHRYNTNCLRNTKKAASSCHAIKNIDISDVIILSKEQFKTFTEFDEDNFAQLEHIFKAHSLIHKGMTYGIYDKNKNLLASAAFLFSNNRAYYWLVGNHPAGKTVGASFMLIDEFIREHAGSGITLDFEGSDTESVAKFYRGFGAVEESYSTIYYSRLPGIFKMFKPNPYMKK